MLNEKNVELTEEKMQRHQKLLMKIKSNISKVIRGKDEKLDYLMTALLAGGHVLLEDVPGVGKTTLAKALAKSFESDYSRVQFTPDLLPADILGSQILNPKEGSFHFQGGPVFTHVLLADEINRASPRTQSALLEAMNEAQVTIDGQQRDLPSPFLVLATQNSVDFQGTYPLPEAQLDRFLLRFDLGYPDQEQELSVLFDRQLGDPLDAIEAVASNSDWLALQEDVRSVFVEESVARYLLRVVQATRETKGLELGVSTRGALALFRASQAYAFLNSRSYVLPDDIQKLAIPVLAHRVLVTSEFKYSGQDGRHLIAQIIDSCETPL